MSCCAKFPAHDRVRKIWYENHVDFTYEGLVQILCRKDIRLSGGIVSHRIIPRMHDHCEDHCLLLADCGLFSSISYLSIIMEDSTIRAIRDTPFGTSDSDEDGDRDDFEQEEDVAPSTVDTGASVDDSSIGLPPRDHGGNPEAVSMQELEESLDEHVRNGTLTTFLTKVDIESDVFLAEYEPWSRPSTARRLSHKKYGTPFHYACCDPDKSRRNEKIRLILEVAKTNDVDLKLVLTASSQASYRPDSLRKTCVFRQ